MKTNFALPLIVSATIIAALFAYFLFTSQSPKSDQVYNDQNIQTNTLPSLKTDRELIVNLSAAEITSLDPIRSPSLSGTVLHTTWSEGLVRVGRNGEIEPAVAKSWTLDIQKKTFHIVLNDDRKWSDDKPVVAQDFISAWKRGLRGNRNRNALFSILLKIKGAKAYANGSSEYLSGLRSPNPFTLIVEFETLDHLFMLRGINGVLMPIPDHFYQQHGENWVSHPDRPYNGFYKPESAPPNLELIPTDEDLAFWMIANDRHPEYKSIKIPRFKFKRTWHVRNTNDGNWRDFLENDEFPSFLMAERSPDIALSGLFSDSGWSIQNYPDNSTVLLYLNREVLAPELVEALKLIVNSREFVSRSPDLFGTATHRLHNLSGSKYDISNSYFNMERKLQLEKAELLLKELGISREQPVELDIETLFFVDPDWLQVLQAILAPYGIEIRQENESTGASNKPTHFTVMLWYVSLPDPSGALLSYQLIPFDIFTEDEQKIFDDLIGQAALQQGDARLAALAKAEEYIVNHSGIVPLYRVNSALIVRSDLGGIVMSSTRIFPINWMYWRD